MPELMYARHGLLDELDAYGDRFYPEDVQDQEAFCHCSMCGGEIYSDEYYEVDGKPVCDGCHDYAQSWSTFIKFARENPAYLFGFLSDNDARSSVQFLLDEFIGDYEEEYNKWLLS